MSKKMTNYEVYIEIKNVTGMNEEYLAEIDYRELFNRMKKKSKVVIQNIFKSNSPSTYSESFHLLDQLDEIGRGVSEKKMVLVYGEKGGKKRYEDYCSKQAKTNTLEYKRQKYGWDENDFEEYNKSRAVTLENLVSRHGEETGKKKYEEYRERQAYTNTKEYLGDRYEEVCKKKAHTFENYLSRYGDEETAIRELEKSRTRTTKFFSKKSQDFCRKLVVALPHLDKYYYGESFGEYAVYSPSCKQCFMYDFVGIIGDKIFAVEFHGDHYHGNPKIYKPDEILRGRGLSKTTAKDKWAADEVKRRVFLTERSGDVIVVWEGDYDLDPEGCVERVCRYAAKL